MVNILAAIPSCTRCHLHKSMPDGCHPVPGDGPLTASMMIVGEALGEQESLLELPFQGMAGRMLEKMLKVNEIDRRDIYITNAVKCRPTHIKWKKVCNRPPFNIEIEKCKSWLYNEICVVRPKVIVTLGKIPTQVLLYKSKHMKKKTFTLKNMTGQQYVIQYHDMMEDIKWTSIVIPCYHPSYLMQHGRKQVDISTKILGDAYEQSKHNSV